MGAGFPQANNYIRKDLVEIMQALGPSLFLKEKENLVPKVLMACLFAEDCTYLEGQMMSRILFFNIQG